MSKIDPQIVSRYPGIVSECILLGWRGSVSHGTYIQDSTHDDKDLMGVVVPDKDHYLGLRGFGSHDNGTKEIMVGDWDVVCYELKKMLRLLIKGNPNVLSLLWLPENLYVTIKDSGRKLIENRKLFATKYVYHSFIGYAYSQLHRMDSGVNLPECGAKRKEIVEEFGYDTKNASHLIRLLRMGIEFLTDGELYVQRKDATELIDIKRGKWTIDEVKKESDHLFHLAEEAYVRSSLPAKADVDKVNELCIDILSYEMSYCVAVND